MNVKTIAPFILMFTSCVPTFFEVEIPRGKPIEIVSNFKYPCILKMRDAVPRHRRHRVEIHSLFEVSGREKIYIFKSDATSVTYTDTPDGTMCLVEITNCEEQTVREALYACIP